MIEQPGTKKTKKPRRYGKLLLFFFLPILVFVFTSLPLINKLTPAVALLAFVAVITCRFLKRVPRTLQAVLWTLVVLSLVGASGWFYSPFFFALYLVAIALGFLYTPAVAVAFILSLLAIFSFSIGEVNPTYDFLTLLSLLAAIPITVALRKSFLLVQEEKKGILILDTGEGEEGITSLEHVLTNRVNKIGIHLRQPITYIKQGLALFESHTLSEEEYVDILKRMRTAADGLFTLVKEFERDATDTHILTKADAGLEQEGHTH